MKLIIQGAMRETIPIWYEHDGHTWCVFSRYERPGDRELQIPDGAKLKQLGEDYVDK